MMDGGSIGLNQQIMHISNLKEYQTLLGSTVYTADVPLDNPSYFDLFEFVEKHWAKGGVLLEATVKEHRSGSSDDVKDDDDVDDDYGSKAELFTHTVVCKCLDEEAMIWIDHLEDSNADRAEQEKRSSPIACSDKASPRGVKNKTNIVHLKALGGSASSSGSNSGTRRPAMSTSPRASDFLLAAPK